jgi:hypothetical protein
MIIFFFLFIYPILYLNKIDSKKNNINEKDGQFMSLKQAKFDVFKFGIKGFDKEQQENAKVQLAIKLGAEVINDVNLFYDSFCLYNYFIDSFSHRKISALIIKSYFN